MTTTDEQRRTAILRAAQQLLEHYGLNKTTVADIARAADIGVGTFYLEFQSKDDVIAQIARHKHEAILEDLRAATTGDGPVLQRMRDFLDTRVNRFQSLRDCGSHVFELVHCRCAPVQSAWAEYLVCENSLLSDLVVEGIERGEIASLGEPQQMARAILDAYAAFMPPRAVGADDRRVAAMHDLVLRGLRP